LNEILSERFGVEGFELVTGLAGPDKAASAEVKIPPVDSTPTAGPVLDSTATKPESWDGRTPHWPITLIRALRVHQWLKNTLVFVPLIANQSFGDPRALAESAVAFLAFSLAASSVYLLNDLFDLDADRRHPRKKFRPLASGRMPIPWGMVLIPLLQGVALTLSILFLPVQFLGVLLGYLFLTLAYSVRLKGAVLLDVMILAGLYTIRVIGGAAATGISLSMWLLAFSMFLFLSLALVKRYAELFAVISGKSGEEKLPARSYRRGDLFILVGMGIASGYLSVLVLALYIVSDEASQHYSDSYLVWLLCPLLLYWISRAWIVVGRQEMHEDPLVWAVKDQISRWVALIAAVVVALAV